MEFNFIYHRFNYNQIYIHSKKNFPLLFTISLFFSIFALIKKIKRWKYYI